MKASTIAPFANLPTAKRRIPIIKPKCYYFNKSDIKLKYIWESEKGAGLEEAEHVIEGAVLEHEKDDAVDGVGALLCPDCCIHEKEHCYQQRCDPLPLHRYSERR